MKVKVERRTIPAETMDSLVREFAGMRISGRLTVAGHEAFKKRATRIARSHGQTFAEVFSEVHRLACPLIARAEPCAPRPSS